MPLSGPPLSHQLLVSISSDAYRHKDVFHTARLSTKDSWDPRGQMPPPPPAPEPLASSGWPLSQQYNYLSLIDNWAVVEKSARFYSNKKKEEETKSKPGEHYPNVVYSSLKEGRECGSTEGQRGIEIQNVVLVIVLCSDLGRGGFRKRGVVLLFTDSQLNVRSYIPDRSENKKPKTIW